MSPRAALTEQDLTQLRRNMVPKGMVGGGDVRSHTKVVRQLDQRKQHPASRPAGSEKQNLLERASSNLAPSPTYRSKWEEQMAHELTLEKRAGYIKDWGYETMSLKLSGRYIHRPDFTVWHHTGEIELRQVKGYHKNIRAAMVGLKWAAQKHPWFIFTLWRRKGRGWESERVEG